MPSFSHPRSLYEVTHSQNNMKQLGLAFHNYLTTYGVLPPRALRNANGKPLLSWRVAILPYLEQDSAEAVLYEKFHLDEPWDSEHNLQLIEKIPAVFQTPNGELSGNTHYLAADGQGSLFGGADGLGPKDMTDGLSYTVMAVEADKEVPWTKPEDLNYNPDDPKQSLGKLRKGRYLVLFADGGVRTLNIDTDESTLRGMMTIDGGEEARPPD